MSQGGLKGQGHVQQNGVPLFLMYLGEVFIHMVEKNRDSCSVGVGAHCFFSYSG